MHTILSLLLSAVLPSLRDRATLQLELIALRHQLLVLERKRTTRPRLSRIDRKPVATVRRGKSGVFPAAQAAVLAV